MKESGISTNVVSFSGRRVVVNQRELEDCSHSVQSAENSGKEQRCCAPWMMNTDEWWTHHPEWTSAGDNFTHTCFQLVSDPAQRSFLRSIYHLQWELHQGDCGKVVQQTQISSGYAAALMATARSFYASYQQQRPFQITRGHAKANWNFSPQNATHWAYCPTVDMNCYYLPLGPCQPIIGRNDAPRGVKPSTAAAKLEFRWIRQYAFRPRHTLREHLAQYIRRAGIDLETLSPCAAIHVRRGDIAFGKGRRYAAVDEYIQAGNISLGQTIVLLTDDVSTIEEVEKYHKDDYRWIYLNRPRFRGSVGGFEGFIPSQDPALEVLAIMAEIQMASICSKLVHGKSGFVAIITEAMENAGHPFETFYLQTQQNKAEQAKMDPAIRASLYLQQIQERLEKKKRSTSVQSST